MTPDVTASVRELLETARLEAQAGPMDVAEIERLIFRAAAPIVSSVASLTEAVAAWLRRQLEGLGDQQGS